MMNPMTPASLAEHYKLREAQRLSRNMARKELNMRVNSTPSKALRRGNYEGGGTSGKAMVKEEKAKPGKRTPNKAEREWMDWIVAHGCIACVLDGELPRPTAVHHILRGTVRMGHLHTLPLCDPGHHQGGAQFGMVSRHPDKAAFEAKYGTEAELLTRLRAEFGAKT